jgi:hypothetical protein
VVSGPLSPIACQCAPYCQRDRGSILFELLRPRCWSRGGIRNSDCLFELGLLGLGALVRGGLFMVDTRAQKTIITQNSVTLPQPSNSCVGQRHGLLNRRVLRQ